MTTSQDEHAPPARRGHPLLAGLAGLVLGIGIYALLVTAIPTLHFVIVAIGCCGGLSARIAGGGARLGSAMLLALCALAFSLGGHLFVAGLGEPTFEIIFDEDYLRNWWYGVQYSWTGVACVLSSYLAYRLSMPRRRRKAVV